MTLLTTVKLAAYGLPQGLALTWAAPLDAACALYGITSLARVSAFIAQVGTESQGFTRLQENLHYSADRLVAVWPSRFTDDEAAQCAYNPEAIANKAYGGRMGNSQPGDGYLYRGRGLIMVTGRANYEAVAGLLAEKLSGAPELLHNPDALLQPQWAAYSAAAFWADHGLNELADTGSFDRITQRINGGQTGATDRRANYERAKRAFA